MSADPPVIWVVVDENGSPCYIAHIGDNTRASVGPPLSAEMRERGATVVRYAPTSRAIENSEEGR